jgi:outer membrane protein
MPEEMEAKMPVLVTWGSKRGRTLALLSAFLLTAVSSATARADSGFTFRTRVVAAGSSDHSDPPGYTVYSAFAVEAGFNWAPHPLFAVEIDARTESREVDVASPIGGEDVRLGSIELLPLNLLAQYRPLPGGALHPYVGAGVNLTTAWEKSGALDSTRITTGIGPAVQLGLDIDLSSSVLLNLDARWNLYRPKLENAGQHVATLKVDPISLGIGLGFRL